MLEFYCSKECQKSHWKQHKLVCKRNSDSPGLRSRHKSCLMHHEVMSSLHLIAHKLLSGRYGEKNTHVVITLKAMGNGLVSVVNAVLAKKINADMYRVEGRKLEKMGAFPQQIMSDIAQHEHAVMLFFDTGVFFVREHKNVPTIPIPNKSVDWLIGAVNKLMVCLSSQLPGFTSVQPDQIHD